MLRRLPVATVRVIAASALALAGLAALVASWRGDPLEAQAATVTASAPAYEKAFYTMMVTRRPSVPGMTALGKALFFDPALSASGKLA